MDGRDNCIKTMIWFNSKTELGYNFSMDNATAGEKVKLKWHNIYNKIRILF